jgi:hypothetical protein
MKEYLLIRSFMNRIKLYRKCLIFFLLIPFFSFVQNQEVRVKDNLHFVQVIGTPHERGFQQGRALYKEIHEVIALWRVDLEKNFGLPADTFIFRFARGTDFLSAIRKYTPDLLEELKGLSEGAEIDFKTLYVFQLIDEVWAMGRNVTRHHCTSFGVLKTESHPVMTGQNLDIPFFHGYQTLIHHKDPLTGWEAFVFTVPGILGANGMNNRPVSVCVNTLLQLKPCTDGLPVDFVVRGILEQDSFEDAVDFIRTIKHAAGQNYLIGDPDQMASYECSVSQTAEFLPFDGAKFTYHTNHPLSNTNIRESIIEQSEGQGPLPELFTSHCKRFQALQSAYPDNSVSIDLKKMKRIFRNRDWIVNNRSTYGCTIMILSGNPELHIAPGRPDEESFRVYRFE